MDREGPGEADREGPREADREGPGGPVVEFRNEPIDIQGLPQLPRDQFEPIDPRYLRIRLVSNAIVAAVVVVAAAVAAVVIPADASVPRWGPGLVAAGLVLLIGLVAWLQRLEISHLGYLVRDQDFSYRQGVVSRTVTTVPFARIQHVSIDRGPLARAFGLATLQLRTAGSGGVLVRGMSVETAQRLKALVVDRSAALADEETSGDPAIGVPVEPPAIGGQVTGNPPVGGPAAGYPAPGAGPMVGPDGP